MLACGCENKESFTCARCTKNVCGKHIFSRVDGNNISITKNAPEYCASCYRKTYGQE